MDKKAVPEKVPARAWLVLVGVYLLSVSAAMFWFSPPPIAGAIIGAYIAPMGVENIQGTFGTLMNYLAWAALIGAVCASFMLNKIGIKWTIIIAGILLIAGNVLAATSGINFDMLVASRWVGGFGVGLVGASASTAISMWFPESRRGVAISIWATWVPVAMLIGFNVIGNIALASDVHNMWWIIGAITVVAFIICLVFYKAPEGGSISVARTPYLQGLKHLKSRQAIAMLVCFFLYTYLSNIFTTYNSTYFTNVLQLDTAVANLCASGAFSFAVTAPIFGMILDKIPGNKKYLMIVVGSAIEIVAICLAFRSMGTAHLAVLTVAIALGNVLLVSSIRPLMPGVVAKGGYTAVSCAMSSIVFLGFFGQVFTSFFGSVADATSWTSAAMMVGLPVAIVMLVTALLCYPPKPKAEAEAGAEQAAQ